MNSVLHTSRPIRLKCYKTSGRRARSKQWGPGRPAAHSARSPSGKDAANGPACSAFLPGRNADPIGRPSIPHCNRETTRQSIGKKRLEFALSATIIGHQRRPYPQSFLSSPSATNAGRLTYKLAPIHTMAWKSVVEGIVTGTATALTWVALLALTNFSRNLMLERRLRKGFSSIGYSFGDNSFGIIFHNTTNVSVKVWGVSFSFPGGGTAPLHFSGEKVAFRKIRLHRFREPGWLLINFPPFRSDEQGGAVSLDFDMSGTWEMNKDRVIALSPPPDGAYCLLEYTTLINTKKRTAVKVARADDLRDAFLRCRGRWVDDEPPNAEG